MINKGLFSSNNDEWETPKDLFNKYNDIYNFTVDLCASDTNYLCNKYFTKSNTCFNQLIFNESIWCNPPYGRKIKDFVKYCYDLSKVNRVVVALLPSRTDTSWFHDYIYGKSNIIFLRGRLKFSNSKNSAPFPSMIVIFRSNY